MKYTTLDKIVRGVLLQKRWPIHFYVECLVHAQRCFEELNMDSLHNVRTVKLDLNAWDAIPLPCDYLDYCKVGFECGQFIRPMAERQGINRLNNFDTNGNKVPFPDFEDVDTEPFYGFYAGLYNTGNFVWFNDNWENTGRFYGSAGDQTATFKILPERKEIQINSNLGVKSIVLEYISDGSQIDCATSINPYAKSAIEAWINWKYKENGRSHSEGERARAEQLWIKEHKRLRARMNPLSTTDIKNLFYRHAHGSIK